MAIIIKTEELVIPVTIGALKFQIDTSDTNIKLVRQKALKMGAKVKQIEKLAEADEEEAEQEIRMYLQESFDSLLEEGAFEQIYDQTPALNSLAKYFIQLVEGLDREINA